VLAGLRVAAVGGRARDREGRDAAARGIDRAPWPALAALAVPLGVDFNLRIPSNAALAALAAAMVAAAAGLRPRPLARPCRVALAVGVVALAAATLARAPGPRDERTQEVVASRHRTDAGPRRHCGSSEPARRSARCSAGGPRTPSPG
jgi:hypothetical protein